MITDKEQIKNLLVAELQGNLNILIDPKKKIVFQVVESKRGPIQYQKEFCTIF